MSVLGRGEDKRLTMELLPKTTTVLGTHILRVLDLHFRTSVSTSRVSIVLQRSKIILLGACLRAHRSSVEFYNKGQVVSQDSPGNTHSYPGIHDPQ